MLAIASRAASVRWCEERGADQVINYREDVAAQLEARGIGKVVIGRER